MKRRPLGTAFFALLLAGVTFTLVLRVMEHQLVRAQIGNVAEHYRAMGRVVHAERFGDVSQAADLLEWSAQVDFVDRRRAVQGFLVCRLNANITGMPSAYFDETGNDNPQRSEVIAWVTPMSITEHEWLRPILSVRVDEILFAQEEHARYGETLRVELLWPAYGESCITDGMVVGERYLVRLAYYRQYWPPPGTPTGRHDPIAGPWVPRAGRNDPLFFLPLYGETWFARDIAPYAAHVDAMVAALYRENRKLYIQTTRDMDILRANHPALHLREGRFLTREDELEAKHVAVVDATFAYTRDVAVGDTLVLEIPLRQDFAGVAFHPASVGEVSHPGFFVPLVLARADAEVYLLEVTVVGITRFLSFNRDRTQSLFVFVPDAILPPSLEITHETYGAEYLPDAWFGFALADLRYQAQFFDEYAELMAEMGLHLVGDFEDAETFWAVVDSILLALSFNLVLFALVAAGVLALTVYLLIRRHMSEMAIRRALGGSALRVFAAMLAAVMVLAVPSVALGGGMAWRFGRFQAERTLARMSDAYDEMTPPTDFELQWEAVFDRPIPDSWDGRHIIAHQITGDVAVPWLPTVAVFAFGFVLAALGIGRVLRLPVLAQLQGSTPGGGASVVQAVPEGTAIAPTLHALPNLTPLPVVSASRRALMMGWIHRYIRRASVKTALLFTVAMTFTVGLGWLMSSVAQTRSDIDTLYDNTYVTGHLSALNRNAVRTFLGLEYLHEVYVETWQVGAQLVRPANGTLPVDWEIGTSLPTPEFVADTLELLEELWGGSDDFFFDPMLSVQAMWNQQNQISIHGTSDVAAFIERHSTEGNTLAVTYLPGLDDSIFNARVWAEVPAHVPLPMIIGMDFMQVRDIEVGDDFILAVNPFGMHGAYIYRTVQIVGTHNWGNFLLMPYWTMPFFSASYHYAVVNFTIDAAYSHVLDETVLSMRTSINPRHLSDGIQIFVDDSELRTVVFAMSQVLLFMTLFMRVVVVLVLGIGSTVAWLLVMTHAKNVALLRTLGIGKRGVAALLCGEQLIICMAAVMCGVLVLFVLGGHVTAVLLAAVIYLTGAAAGMGVGAFLCLHHAPLDLLQVRE